MTLTPEEAQRKAHEHEMAQSHNFRYWLKHEQPWINPELIKVLTHELAAGKEEEFRHLLNELEHIEAALNSRRNKLLDLLKVTSAEVREISGPMVQHQAFMNAWGKINGK